MAKLEKSCTESKSMRSQANKILKEAKKRGLEANYFFVTTFDRYQMQIDILDKLKAEIEGTGPLVTKEYVKGRENTYTNPAITEYNKTATAANGTVTTLINILKQLTEESTNNESIADVMKKMLADD